MINTRSLEDRAILVAAKRAGLEQKARRALLTVVEHLTLCKIVVLGRVREHPDPNAKAVAQLEETELRLREAEERADILAARLARIPPRRRPYYTPEQRFRILQHMRAYLLSVDETARRFLITPQAIYEWLNEVRQNPETTTIGSRLKPSPPVRRYADVVRETVRQMKRLGFEGCGQIARTLARVGWKISPTSAWRFAKEKLPSPPTAPNPGSGEPRKTVSGRHPNHLWLVDITRVRSIFPFLYFHVAVVLDAYSRMPLASAVSLLDPSAAAMLALIHKALDNSAGFGRPRHLVSDQGTQFTAELFRQAMRRLGIRQRFGAVGKHGSIGLIDRFFRTVKQDLSVRAQRPRSRQELERRLSAALVRYAYHRPHSALQDRVPAEAYFGLPRQAALFNSAPRGRAGERAPERPFDIALLDPETRTLPILISKAA